MNEQQSKVTTGNQDSTGFSTVWKTFFHGVENRRAAPNRMGSKKNPPPDFPAGAHGAAAAIPRSNRCG